MEISFENKTKDRKQTSQLQQTDIPGQLSQLSKIKVGLLQHNYVLIVISKWIIKVILSSSLCLNFTSFATADERVNVHNIKIFPPTKLYSVRDVSFVLNEHGDLFDCFSLVYKLSFQVKILR